MSAATGTSGAGSDTTGVPKVPEKLATRLRGLSTQLAVVEGHLDPLLKLPMVPLLKSLPPLERTKLEVAIAFSLNALFFVYLKTQGVAPAEHPVMAKLKRVKTYLRRIKQLESGGSQSRVSIDTSVVKRVVKRHLASAEIQPTASKKQKH